MQLPNNNIHIVLRLPVALADKVRQQMKSGEDTSSLPLNYRPVGEAGEKARKDKVADYVFTFEDKEYPALLVNLPAPVELHKTVDNKLLVKCGDVGQMLHVFDDLDSLRSTRDQIAKSKTPLGECLPHGLTPPTFDIVHRRYDKTRVASSFLPYKVRTVIADIGQYSSHAQQQAGEEDADRVIEIEEVVEYQDWMMDPNNPGYGRTITVDGANWPADCELLAYYPEILLSNEDREEDELERLAQLEQEEERLKQKELQEDEAIEEAHDDEEDNAGEENVADNFEEDEQDGADDEKEEDKQEEVQAVEDEGQDKAWSESEGEDDQ